MRALIEIMLYLPASDRTQNPGRMHLISFNDSGLRLRSMRLSQNAVISACEKADLNCAAIDASFALPQTLRCPVQIAGLFTVIRNSSVAEGRNKPRNTVPVDGQAWHWRMATVLLPGSDEASLVD